MVTSKQKCSMDITGMNIALKNLSRRYMVICVGIAKIELNQHSEDLVLYIIEGV